MWLWSRSFENVSSWFARAAHRKRVGATPSRANFPAANELPDFVPFVGDRLEFDTIIARLERLDAYAPLAHLGWIQPARQSGDAVPFKIEAANDGEFHITGSVTLYKKRYIHLQVDLEMEPTNPAPEAETDSNSRRQSETSFSRERNDRADRGPLEALDQALVYRLNESRRIRGVDAHYFDHPQFGVIARIKEIKLDEDGSDGTGS